MNGNEIIPFTRTSAQLWLEAADKYNDLVRYCLVAPTILFLNSYFSENPISRTNFRLPPSLLIKALSASRNDNDHSASPNLKGAVLWDICERESYLRKYSVGKSASLGSLVPREWRQRLARSIEANNSPSFATVWPSLTALIRGAKVRVHLRPHLISLIEILEHEPRPEKKLAELLSLVRRTGYQDAPIFVVTLDPDFFCYGLPSSECAIVKRRGNPKLGVRDPAQWERMFADVGFLVLDQRPIHIDLLPDFLGEHIHELFKSFSASDSVAVDRSLPRQGPYYFWLLLPRSSEKKSVNAEAHNFGAKIAGSRVRYAPNEIVEVQGNLGSRVHAVERGQLFLPLPALTDKDFIEGALLGQLEIGRNYFASRLPNHVTAKTDSTVLTFPLDELSPVVRNDQRLFWSMIGHWEDQIYSPHISAVPLAGKRNRAFSKVVPRVMRVGVRNCAAVILNACAQRSRSLRYSGRVLIRLTFSEFEGSIKHQYPSRDSEEPWMDALDHLVQSGAIDCFSAKSIKKLHAEVPDDDSTSTNDELLNLGLIAARHLVRWAREEKGWPLDVGYCGLEISRFLGFPDEGQKKVKPSRSLDRLLSHIEGVSGGRHTTEKELAMPNLFLDLLKREFDGQSKRKFESRFSNYICVRDVWALLACVFDNDDLWKSEISSASFPSRQHSRRLVSYFSECIALLAKQALDPKHSVA